MKSLSVVALLSDLHGDIPDHEDLPEADMLIIAGDVCPLSDHSSAFQEWWLDTVFRPWLYHVPMPVAGVAGNHDFVAQEDYGYELMASLPWTYLQDDASMIDGLTIYGSPYSNLFGRWAFMENDTDLAERWSWIPKNLDILITHGPAYGLRDRVNNNWGDADRDKNVGSKNLRQVLADQKPRLHVTGHIHEAYGRIPFRDTIVVNASYNNERYDARKNPIQVVTL